MASHREAHALARLTIADLQQMKRDGKKIAAGICYEVQMARIFERAGADLLSVAESVGRTFLGRDRLDGVTVDEMLVFGKAVARVAQRAVVSVDIPISTCRTGPREVAVAALRIKDEAHADMAKVDIREMEEELFDDVPAVVEAGLPVYPQIGFPAEGEPRRSPSDHDHIMKWAQAVQDAGASVLNLTNVSHEIYADVTKSLWIPVIGGHAGPEADGRIYISYGLVGYQAGAIDRTNGRPSAAKFMYDIAKKHLDEVHSGTW